MGLDLNGLVDDLIDITPYDEPPTPDTKDDTQPPPAEEDTEDEKSIGKSEPRDREDEQGNPRGRNP